MTLRYAAAGLGVAFEDVKGFEHGSRALHHAQVTTLLDMYRVYDERKRDRLIALARATFRLPRWEDDFHAAPLDPSMLDVLWLETVAEQILCFSSTLVPDLLRIPAYVEAVVRREFCPASDDQQVSWWVRAYRDRQRVLEGGPPKGLRALVTDSALRRRLGARPGTLRAQLDHLAAAADGGAVQLRVFPAEADYLPGLDGSFTVFQLPQPYPDVVACTHHLNGLAIHEERGAEQYATAFDRLWDAALPPPESAALIAHLATETTD